MVDCPNPDPGQDAVRRTDAGRQEGAGLVHHEAIRQFSALSV